MRKERAKEVGCDNAIKKTLAYRAVFNYPLTYHQLYNFLISDKKFDDKIFDKELKKLVKQNEIGFKDGLYYNKTIRPVSWKKRFDQTKEVIEIHKKTFKLLSKIPWVKMVGITGSVAAYNTDKNADIDIIVVTRKNRLWISRLFVALLLKAANLYVRKDAEPEKFCPNIFMSEDELEWPKENQNVYTAHEIVIMQPMFQKNNVYFDFVKSNDWIKRHFQNFEVYSIDVKRKSEPKSGVISFFEKILQTAQLTYMQNRKTNEITTDKLIHFRKNDNSKWILENYGKNSAKDSKKKRKLGSLHK